MSETASNIVPGSDQVSAANLLSSHLGSSYKSQNNLSQLIWQLPYAERKSILQQQQRVIEAATEQEMADASEDLGDDEIAETQNEFDLAEDTDLNEEELDLNVNRKMSIRALNVITMHRFSPGSIVGGGQRMSFVGVNSPRDGADNQTNTYAQKPPPHKSSLLVRASNLMQANARKSTLNRLSKMTS